MIEIPKAEQAARFLEEADRRCRRVSAVKAELEARQAELTATIAQLKDELIHALAGTAMQDDGCAEQADAIKAKLREAEGKLSDTGLALAGFPRILARAAAEAQQVLARRTLGQAAELQQLLQQRAEGEDVPADRSRIRHLAEQLEVDLSAIAQKK